MLVRRAKALVYRKRLGNRILDWRRISDAAQPRPHRMSPACCMHHTRVAHTIVRGVTVDLQDTVEASKKLLRAIPSSS